jgi:hypothetical protein
MIKERMRSKNPPETRGPRGDHYSSTMKSYPGFNTISPINDKFASTSPISGVKSEFNFTNLNKDSKTPAADYQGKHIETFFDACNSRN